MSVDPEELAGEEEPQEPIAHVRIIYTGPVAPHWDIAYVAGDEAAVDDFRARALARLQLLPPHDPQFRRNRERVNRDAERELIELVWDLGYDEGEAEEAASLGDKPTPTAPLVGADDTAVEASDDDAGDGSEDAAAEAAAASEDGAANAESAEAEDGAESGEAAEEEESETDPPAADSGDEETG